jgi:hypothetical protein
MTKMPSTPAQPTTLLEAGLDGRRRIDVSDIGMFLSPQQLLNLTGRRRASAQIRWLRQSGYRFAVNALGHPVVAEAEVRRKLVGAPQRVAPDFSSLRSDR